MPGYNPYGLQRANPSYPAVRTNPTGLVAGGNGLYIGFNILQLISAAASGFHGYKRNCDSVGWGFAWGALGAVLPVLTPAYAIIFQGYARRNPAGCP